MVQNKIHQLDSLAKFKDKNKNIRSDLFFNQFSRIESEYNISRNIYNELALNKEKIRDRRDKKAKANPIL